MKLVYYTDQIYKHGGLERVISNKLNYLAKNTDLDLHLITFQNNNNIPCYSINNKVNFHDLDINYNRNITFLHPRNVKYILKHFSRLKKLLKKIKPDIIIVCNYEYGFFFVPYLAKNSLTIKEYHSTGHFHYLNRQHNQSILKKIRYKFINYFQSKYNYIALLNKDELNYYSGENKIVIPNSLTFKPDQQSSLNEKCVISAGRIAPVKGFDDLIESWVKIRYHHPEWKLKIFGDGETDYIEELKNIVDKLNLKENILFMGPTKNLKQEMLNSSMYAMTSGMECFPMVLLEAMSCGLPIVSYDCPTGPRNIIQDNIDGILVDYKNKESMSNAIIELIENIDKRILLGKNGFINANKFTEHNVMTSWLNIFKTSSAKFQQLSNAK